MSPLVSSGVEDAFLQAGISGAFLLLTLTALVYLYRQREKEYARELARETGRADRNEDRYLESNKVIQEKVIPAIESMVTQTRELTDLIRTIRERELYDRGK